MKQPEALQARLKAMTILELCDHVDKLREELEALRAEYK